MPKTVTTGVTIKYRAIDPRDGTGLISAWKGDTQVGSLAFGWPSSSRIRERYKIQLGYMKVIEGHRREGVATQMLLRFLEEFDPDTVAYFDVEPDGEAFMNSFAERHPEYADWVASRMWTGA